MAVLCVIAVIKIRILSYWPESYWGGTASVIGGGLLIGSLPGLIGRPRIRSGIPAAVGIALLANSRPFEGLVVTALVLSHVVRRVIRESADRPAALSKLTKGIVIPVAVVMLPVGAQSTAMKIAAGLD
jgi:hypothetical protein